MSDTVINYPIDWVRIEKYCELTGETEQSVKNKRNSGLWAEGVQYRKAGDGRYWYNWKEINKWLATSTHKSAKA